MARTHGLRYNEKLTTCFFVSLTRLVRHSPRAKLLGLARPQRALWSGDGLGAQDTLLGYAGPKNSLGHAGLGVFLSDVPQQPLLNGLKDATRCLDAL
jgi:hypothetical protein